MSRYTTLFSVCLLVASVGFGDANRPSWVVEKLRASLSDEAELLWRQLVVINDDLVFKLPGYKSPEANFRLAEELIAEELSLINQFTSEKQKAADNRLRRLASLKNLATVCDLETLKFYRIQSIVEYYQAKHIEACEPVYKDKYNKLIQSLEKDTKQNYLLVHELFKELNASDFSQLIGYDPLVIARLSSVSQREHLMAMPIFKLESDAPDALSKIVEGIGNQLPEKSNKSPIGGAESGYNFDQLLFEPCTQFRNELGEVLEPAVIAATFVNDFQRRLLSGDKNFFQDMFVYGLCGKLIDEREQLYAKFNQILANKN